MAATLTQIAEKAGVSVSLVSRLVRGDRTLRVSDETRKRVEGIKRKLGGVRRLNSAPQRFVRKETRNIVVPLNRIFSPTWVQDFLTNTITGQLMRGFESTLSAERFRMSLTFVDEASKLKEFTALIETPDYCDGLLLLTSMADREVADLLVRHRFPHVSMEGQDERLGVNTVCVHHSDGMVQLVSHLVSLGHRQISFVGTANSERYSHYVAAMARAGLEAPKDGIYWIPEHGPQQSDQQWQQAVQEQFRQCLDKPLAASALICNNDHIAMIVLQELKARGIRVPQDVSVSGFDNVEAWGPLASPHPMLTTVDNPQEQIGRQCAQRLIAQVQRKQAQVVHERLPAQLIVRKTTGLAALPALPAGLPGPRGPNQP